MNPAHLSIETVDHQPPVAHHDADVGGGEALRDEARAGLGDELGAVGDDEHLPAAGDFGHDGPL